MQLIFVVINDILLIEIGEEEEEERVWLYYIYKS